MRTLLPWLFAAAGRAPEDQEALRRCWQAFGALPPFHDRAFDLAMLGAPADGLVAAGHRMGAGCPLPPLPCPPLAQVLAATGAVWREGTWRGATFWWLSLLMPRCRYG